MERFGRYAFSLMFIGLGILILAWFRLFQSGDDRWLIGLGFIGGGIALVIMFLIMGRLAKGKARLFAEATPGTGAITAVEKSMRAHGEEHDAGFWLTMTVEVPGRAPFTARVHGSFSLDVAKRLQPGLVIPVRVHPSNPQKPLIGTDSLLRPLR